MKYAKIENNKIIRQQDTTQTNITIDGIKTIDVTVQGVPILDKRDEIIGYEPDTIEQQEISVKIVNPSEQDYIDAGWLPVITETPLVDQRIGDPVITATEVTYPAIDKPIAEIASETEAHIMMMDQSARAYIDGSAHWAAAPMIFDKAKAGLPKSLAIMQWTEAVWTAFYTRSAQLQGGMVWSDDMLDFSDVGNIPYPISEAMTE